MNKFLFFLLFLAVSLAYVFELDQIIARNLNPFNGLKKLYIDTSLSIQNNVEKYFKQVVTIESLQKENKELKSYKLLYQSAKDQLDTILEVVKDPNSTTTQIRFTRVLSYVQFDDFTKVWLDMKMKNNKILGVISDGYAAGIVVNQDGKAKALLNGNEKSNYSIFVGKDKAPGIIHSAKNRKYLVAKFVPIWYEIKIGDEVITSGMDNIFFEGLKVGHVVSIKKLQDMQELTIEPYAKVLKQKYFYIYERSEEKEEKRIETKEQKEEKKANN